MVKNSASDPNQLQRAFAFIIRSCVIIVLIVAVSNCMFYLVNRDIDIQAARDANGGVVPGKEVIDNRGQIYGLSTIEHDGKTYMCFKAGKSFACAQDKD